MNETPFNPAFEQSRFASTEFAEHLGDYKIGLVHDEKAEMMGGIRGHAGLFSTAKDLHLFACMIEQSGKHQGVQILTRSVVELSKQNHTPFVCQIF